MGYDQLHGIIAVTNLAPGETASSVIVVHPRMRGRQPDREHPEQHPERDRGRGHRPRRTADRPDEGHRVRRRSPRSTSRRPARRRPFGDDVVSSSRMANDGNEAADHIVVSTPCWAGTSRPRSACRHVAQPAPRRHGVVPLHAGCERPDPLQNTVTVTAAGAFSAPRSPTTARATPTSRTCRASTSPSPARHPCRSVRRSRTRSPSGTRATSRSKASPWTTPCWVRSRPPRSTRTCRTRCPWANTVYTATVSCTPVAGDPDPLTNTVTATGTGVDSGVEASDEASCTTDITHEPGIDVTKSCPASVPFGEDIEYTITVRTRATSRSKASP